MAGEAARGLRSAVQTGILMLRNPDDRLQEFALDPGAVFELPRGAPTSYSLRRPCAEDVAKAARTAEAGKHLRLTLQPFEVVVLDAVHSAQPQTAERTQGKSSAR